MIALFLEYKSPLDATDSTGYTALHHAIAEGHGTSSTEGVNDLPPPTNSVGAGDAAVTLLKAGADNTKRDGDGILAIDLAPDREVRP